MKEEADHSLYYMISVEFLDGQLMPEQCEKDRIRKSDVQFGTSIPTGYAN